MPISRMLGQVDQDDPTNLPAGCAAVCRNTDFTRDSTGGALDPSTRAGNCLTMQGAKSAGTGLWDFQYEAESASDPFTGLQMPTVFRLNGVSEYESPAGTGHTRPVPAGMFTPPVNSHRIDTQAGNIQWSAYSALTARTAANPSGAAPTAGLSGFNPKTLNLDPLGMKPYGWRWLPNTSVVYRNEVATPSDQSAGPQGNGHTYQAQKNGATGPVEPVWPSGPGSEGATVAEVLSPAQIAAGLTPVVWKEATMVIANRLPAPAAPALALSNGAGTFPASQTVSIFLTLLNGMGETVAGVTAQITTTALDQAVLVTIPTLAQLPGWISELVAPYAVTTVNVYEADVASASPAPPQSSFELVGNFALGAVATVTATASGAAAPTINSARITPGQLPAPIESGVLTRSPSAGTFAAGRDVWIRLSFSNANGETPLGPSNSIVNTLLDDAVIVDLTQLAEAQEFPQLKTVNVYEADVPTGTTEPPISAYALAFASTVGATVTVIATASGKPSVTVNGTGPGGNVVADMADGGINATQGYRYAVPAWMNRNETISGFTEAAVSKYIVDEDGWEIAVFKVPVGPLNVIGRVINWSVADSTQAGPFFWIGLVDIEVPTQNIVYPNSFLSDGIEIIPTVFLDNVTTSGTFNFTDEFLEADNDSTDRLRVVAPLTAIRVDYAESCDRLFLATPDYPSGPVISLSGDYESYYGDTSPLPIPTNGGERYWGVVEFRNQIYAMRSKSGWVITPGTGDPSSWDINQRWKDQGAVGPRAFAACGDFIAFVYYDGLYRYPGTTGDGKPDLMTKEVPRQWGSINWAAASSICLTIDEPTHTIRLQVPTGQSLTPNQEFCLSYEEGWLNPIHFSSFKDTEISQEAARRWSFNDVSSFVCKRLLRTIPNPPPQVLGPDGTSQLTSDFYVSQLCYTQTDDSGIVNARTPGRFDDNGAGIDWQYEGISSNAMQKPSKPEGVTLNIVGFGDINVSFVSGRRKVTGNNTDKFVLKCEPVPLTPDSPVEWTRRPARRVGDFWRVRLDNGRQPGVWASVKKITPYFIATKTAHGALDPGVR